MDSNAKIFSTFLYFQSIQVLSGSVIVTVNNKEIPLRLLMHLEVENNQTYSIANVHRSEPAIIAFNLSKV